MHRETRFFLYLRYFKDYKKFSKARKQFFKFYLVRFTFKNQELAITSSALGFTYRNAGFSAKVNIFAK